MKNFRQYINRPWIYVGFALIGILIKFYHIDYRHFWLDEISTIEQTSGLNREGMMNLVPANEVINITYYKRMLQLNEQDLSIGSQLKKQLNTMNLNPLHYALLVFWHRIVGDEPVHYRYFSLFLFLLTVPFVYLLAKKLFGFKLSGWIAVSLFSVFPYFHYYTHEARYIILAVFFIVSCSYFLVQASDHNRFKWWLGYIITGSLALYSSILLGLLIFGQFLFIFLLRKKSILPFLISVSIILLSYLPWFVFIINSYTEVSAAMAWHELFNDNLNAFSLIYSQLMLMSRSVVSLTDINTWFYGLNGEYLNTLLYALIAIFIIISIVYAKRKMKQESFYFLLFMLIPSFLFFLITDLVREAGTSLFGRYHYLNFVAAMFFLAFFFIRKVSRKKIGYFTIYIAIAALGIISSFRISQSRNWDIYPHYDFAPAQYVDNSERCLIISDFTTPQNNSITAFLMIVNEIQNENVDILYTLPDNPAIKSEIIKNNYAATYVLYPSEQLLINLKSQFDNQLTQLQSKELYNPFWQIEPPSQQERLITIAK